MKEVLGVNEMNLYRLTVQAIRRLTRLPDPAQ
jgi:hypothetical protein